MVTYWTKNCISAFRRFVVGLSDILHHFCWTSSQGPCRSLDISSLLPIFICSFPILRNPRQLGNLNVTFAVTVQFHSTRSQTLCTDAGYQRFFLACGEICRCRSKGDTAFSAAQRFTIKMEFMACLLSRRLSLSVKFGLTLPMVPCASSPVARVSRSSLCETLRKTKRLRKRLGWGCVHTIPESFSCPQMKSYKLRATALTTKIEMTLH